MTPEPTTEIEEGKTSAPPVLGELPPPTDQLPAEETFDPEEVLFDLTTKEEPVREPLPSAAAPGAALVAQIAQTDAKLDRWRSTSEARKAAWLEEQQLRDEELARRKRVGLVAGGVGAVVGVVAVASLLWFSPWANEVLSPTATATPTPPVSAPVVAPAPAPQVVAPAAPVTEAPAKATANPIPAPTTHTKPALGPTLVEGSQRLWTREGHAWTRFSLMGTGPFEIAWVDAAGHEVLDRMPCRGQGDTTRSCYAGRSAARIHYALAQGAAPGRWVVRGCSAEGCVDVGSFTAPLD